MSSGLVDADEDMVRGQDTVLGSLPNGALYWTCETPHLSQVSGLSWTHAHAFLCVITMCLSEATG